MPICMASAGVIPVALPGTNAPPSWPAIPDAAHSQAGCAVCSPRNSSTVTGSSVGWSAWKNKLNRESSLPLPAEPMADPRLSSAAAKAIASLDAENRFLLAEYYLDGRSLAEIARTLGVHESTISRKLQRVANDLRKDIKRDLVRTGMSGRAAEEALQADVRDLEINVRQLLTSAHNNSDKPSAAQTKSLQESAARSFHAGEGKK